MALLSGRGLASGVGKVMKTGRFAALALSLALGACGGLENPDLTRGAVSGRVANGAATGGYVYVLDAPGLTAPIAADGTFTVGAVPVGPQLLVLVAGYEGGGASVVKAALAPVTVRPGMRERVSEDAAQMPAAGRVVAAVRPPPGAVPEGAAFSVLKSNQVDKTAPAGGGLVLGDLPAGPWQVTARLAGHRASGPVAAEVPAGGAVQVEIELEVESDDDRRGCLSTDCDNGLRCNPGDGRCYACLDVSDCNPDDTCDPESHTCREGSDGAGELCELADSDARCPGGIRVPTAGALGYCSRACPGGDADCPSGWACQASAGGPRCEVKPQPDPSMSCLATRAAFGTPCSQSSSCGQALYGSACVRGDEDEPGTCSARCTSDQSCADAGLGSAWTCRVLPGAAADSQRYCRR